MSLDPWAERYATMSALNRPESATNLWVNGAGLGSLLLVLPLIGYSGLDPVQQVLVIMLAAVAPIVLLDLCVRRIHLRETAGLIWRSERSMNVARVGVKLVGMWATLALIGICYWAFPEYSRPLYQPFWRALGQYGPWVALLAIPYFFVIDAHMREPHDGYWHFGSWVLGGRENVSRDVIFNHLAGWTIKGYFLPLMFSYLAGQVPNFHADFIRILDQSTFLNFFDVTMDLIFLVDLVFATAGYTLMLRLLDSHLRWAEPTAIGWLVAIVCYEPFWNPIASEYLMYHGPVNWISWLAGFPVLQVVWGSTILFLMTVYAWGGVSFGCRFSNLTNRGIITSGPFRFTKHPQYISKNLSWWLFTIPWINPASPALAIKQCLLLAGVNGIYYLRAKTEERNLRHDATYAAYCDYIDKHGLFASIRRFLSKMIGPARARADRPGSRPVELFPSAGYLRGR
jgi:protein-S-isoprenylcysteine O-methyltransferase Ste14